MSYSEAVLRPNNNLPTLTSQCLCDSIPFRESEKPKTFVLRPMSYSEAVLRPNNNLPTLTSQRLCDSIPFRNSESLQNFCPTSYVL